jgi:crotonobetainyl-CoA:carnitine CoA-transferase CaiB-like acyl-CoA transferase
MLAVSAKYQFYRTKDGKYLLFCALESKFWDHFCEVAGRDDLRARHDRTVQMDFGNDSSLRAELQAIFHTRTQQEWMALFAERDVPVGPALDFSEVHEDPHLAARGMLIDEKHPVAGAFRTLGNPIRVRGQSFAIRVPAPALGEHTDEVLATLGYSAQDIAGLRKRGVV